MVRSELSPGGELGVGKAVEGVCDNALEGVDVLETGDIVAVLGVVAAGVPCDSTSV